MNSTNKKVPSHGMVAGTDPHHWRFTTMSRRHATYITMLFKYLVNTNLPALTFAHLCHAIRQTATLTKLERNDNFINLRALQNLLSIYTYHPTNVQNIISMEEVLINSKFPVVLSHVANYPSNARGVIHGTFADVPGETLRAELNILGRKN
ncbi:hypothetical protein HPB48_019900 [Haemaphysalis longicornis]|uniref:Uncharacterized protein n=1 Tax=Haemaphysalis longicornis TaxID=44386 RepID=A0A9J6GMC1_HAELO|nr:hypothetical protein HPB48_019900 [Haemaphysalis longicornis]